MSGERPGVAIERSAVRVGFALLALAWLVWLVGLARGAWLRALLAVPGDDVTDSLRRSGYIAERLVVFDAAAVAVGVAAGLALLAAERASGWGVLAWALLVPSVLLHGLALLAHVVLAT